MQKQRLLLARHRWAQIPYTEDVFLRYSLLLRFYPYMTAGDWNNLLSKLRAGLELYSSNGLLQYDWAFRLVNWTEACSASKPLLPDKFADLLREFHTHALQLDNPHQYYAISSHLKCAWQSVFSSCVGLLILRVSCDHLSLNTVQR